jgi:7-carboxy-7-deazaguanine synthase
MRVSEVFYSLQGEGGRAGEPSVFVRLSGCTAKHACATSGVVCDTEFESGVEMLPSELDMAMKAAVERVIGHAPEVRPWIVWTGGEPLDQLTMELLAAMHDLGWRFHAIETSGIKPMDELLASQLDWITISPKVAEHILARHYPWAAGVDPITGAEVHELRYVRHAGQPGIPEPTLLARNYYLSPHSDGLTINTANVKHCVQLCLEHPKWKLSVQQHKLWKVL